MINVRRRSGALNTDLKPYFSIKTLTDNASIIFTIPENVNYSYLTEIGYSLDNQETWHTFYNGSPIGEIRLEGLSKGTRVYFRGNGTRLCSGTTYSTTNEKNCNFSGTGQWELGGNLATLLYGGYAISGESVYADNCSFIGLFYGNTCIVDASKMTLGSDAAGRDAYIALFRECHNLRYPPILSPTTIGSNCYFGAFRNCTSLEYVPELPAQNLSGTVYSYMFANCPLITRAVLPATSLTGKTYQYMFFNSPNMEYIEYYGSDNPVNHCSNWLSGVASSGTFKILTGVPYDLGVNGVPYGWEVVEI